MLTSKDPCAKADGSPNAVSSSTDRRFRRWYDLDVPERREQKVTVFDDRFDVYRDEDLNRLRDLSDVVALSDRQTLRDLLAT